MQRGSLEKVIYHQLSLIWLAVCLGTGINLVLSPIAEGVGRPLNSFHSLADPVESDESAEGFFSEKWKQVFQVGSNRGYVVYGFEFPNSAIRTSWLSLGYSPSFDSVNGLGRGIFQLNLGNSFRLAGGMEEGRLELEVGAHIALNGESFFLLPDHYPRDYYPQNMIFLSLGARYLINHEYFVMGSVIDYYFEVLYRNPLETFIYLRALSLGFGKRF